jgi:hypothetical protein
VWVFGVLRKQGLGLGRIVQLHIDDEHRLQGRFARVKAALEHCQRRQRFLWDGQLLGSQRGQGLDRVRRQRPVGVGLGRGIGGAWWVHRQG